MNRVYSSKLFYMVDYEKVDTMLTAEIAVFHQCPNRFSIILDDQRYYLYLPKEYQAKSKLLVTKLEIQLHSS